LRPVRYGKRVVDPMTGLRSDAAIEPAEPREASEWLRNNGVTLVAVTLIAIQLLWMGDLLAHSYFRQDDYSYLYRGLDSGFGWHYLMWEDAGQLMPSGMALAWVLARVSLYNWPLTCAITLLLLTAVCFAMLRTLRTLFGNRPAILVPLAVFLFSPLQLAGISWWSVVLNILPLELALLMAIDAHVRYLRGRRMRNAVAAAGWLVVALAASDKGAVVPLLLFGLTAAFFAGGRLTAAAVTAAARFWRAWLAYGIVLAGWGALYLSQLSGSTVKPGRPGSASHVLDFLSTMTGTTLLPAVLGGPWRWSAVGYDIASPPAALQQLSWAVAAVVVVVSCARRVHAWRAWGILAAWIFAADVVPVVLGRLGNMPASLLAAQTRYLMDAAPVLALCVGLAFLPVAGPPVAGEQNAVRFRLPAPWPAALLTLGVFLVGSFWSLQAFESLNSAAATAARSYIATARIAVAEAPRGTTIVDGPTAASIMDPAIFGPYGYTSQVVGAIARGEPAKRLSWTGSPRGVIGNLMIFNDLGQLLPATVPGPLSWPPPKGQSCWNVTTTATQIPLNGSLWRWPWTARVDYSGPSSVLEFRYGGSWTRVALSAGTHAAYIPVTGQGDEVSVQLAQPGPALCITGISVGSLQLGGASGAIPAVPAGAAGPAVALP
jgi:hypothetical protein